MSKTVLYTAIVNNRDSAKPIEFRNDFDYVLFTDKPNINAPGWTVKPIQWFDADPVRIARYHKHHPIELFPDHENSIWLDATHYPIADLTPLLNFTNNYEISCMRHFQRTTSQSEAVICAKNKMDDPEIIKNQIEYYKQSGFPDDLGLFETSCLIRKHTETIKNFQILWWNEIQRYSKRDQLSFTYCLWKAQLECGVLPGYCRIKPNNYFKMVSHYPMVPICSKSTPL